MHYILAIIVAVTLYSLQRIYYEKHWHNNLTAKVTYDKSRATIGETITLTETVTNQKMLPIPILYVKFSTSRTFLFEDLNNAAVSDHYHRNDIFSIMGNQQITRSLQFRTTKRGYYSTEHINLVANDLFMSSSYATKLDNFASLYVYPALLKDRFSQTLTSSIIGNLTKKDLYEDPLSFRGIRDYTTTDRMRSVNWKASAKNQQLMVNTYFDVQNTEVVLLMNLDTNTIQRDDRLQEYIISLATTLLHAFNANGIATRLAINIPDPFTNKVITTDLGIGTEHLQSMLQILSRLNLKAELTPFENFFIGEHSLFDRIEANTSYLILSNYRKEQLLSLYQEKRSKGFHVHFVCPEHINLCTPIPNVQYWEVNTYEI